MKIRVKPSGETWSISQTGKGKFASRLCEEWLKTGIEVTDNIDVPVDIDLQIGRFHYEPSNCKKVVFRSGNAHIDTKSDYIGLNKIKRLAIQSADAIIYQSRYSKEICDAFISKTNKPYKIIFNGATPSVIPQTINIPTNFCAVTRDWTPQKRLKSIVKNWIAADIKEAILYIAGNTHGMDRKYPHKTIKYLGIIDDANLQQIYCLCAVMIHIVYLDACPNSVCEALVNGCHILCNNNGGTQELIKNNINGSVLPCDKNKYNFEPINLQKPQPMADITDYIRQYQNIGKHNNYENVNIKNIARQYIDFFKEIL